MPNLLTPDEIRLARESLGLSQQQLAEALCMRNDGARRVRAWEHGEREITGPASVAIRLMAEKRRAVRVEDLTDDDLEAIRSARVSDND